MFSSFLPGYGGRASPVPVTPSGTGRSPVAHHEHGARSVQPEREERRVAVSGRYSEEVEGKVLNE